MCVPSKRANAANCPPRRSPPPTCSRRLRANSTSTPARPCRSPSSSTRAWELAGEGLQGLVTYIRTDSTRISDEALASVREMIKNTYGEPFLPAEPNIYKSRKTAQDAHEAIRPTDISRRPEAIKSSLTRDQFRLYRLIYDRFVSSQMTPAVFDTLSADIAGENGLTFHLAGQKMKFAGFTAVYEEVLDDAVEEKDISLPDLEEGMNASPAGRHRRTALHPAAAPLHGGLAGARTGRKGHWPPLHLRADHLHHHHPRLCGAREQAPHPHGTGQDRQRSDVQKTSRTSSTYSSPPTWRRNSTMWKTARWTGTPSCATSTGRLRRIWKRPRPASKKSPSRIRCPISPAKSVGR